MKCGASRAFEVRLLSYRKALFYSHFLCRLESGLLMEAKGLRAILIVLWVD
jgi:hypothetical protein